MGQDHLPAAATEPTPEQKPRRRLPFRWRRYLPRWRAGRLSDGIQETASLSLKVGTLVLILLLTVLLLRSVRDQGFVIEPFSVPEALDKAGYNGAVVARSIFDEVHRLKNTAGSVKADSVQLIGSDTPELDVAVLGLGLSLRSISYHLRELFGRKNRLIRGDITRLGTQYRLVLRMTDFAPLTYRVDIADGQEAVAIDRLLRLAGEGVLLNTDPYRLAVAYYKERRLDEAMVAVRRLVKERPNEAHWAYLAWGSILEEKQDFAAARDKFLRATQIMPDFDLAWLRLGYAYDKLGEEDPAIAAIQRAIALDPQQIGRHLNLAWMYHRQGHHAIADSLFESTCTRFPDEPNCWVSWADSKMNRQDHRGALELLDHVSDQLAENARSYLIRAMASYVSGDSLRALHHLQTAYNLDPQDALAARLLMSINYQQRDYASVVSIATQTDLWQPQFEKWERQQMLNYLAMAQNMLGQHNEAERSIRRSIAQDTSAGYPYSTLAETYAFRQQPDSFYYFLQLAFDKGMNPGIIDLREAPYASYEQDERLRRMLLAAMPNNERPLRD